MYVRLSLSHHSNPPVWHPYLCTYTYVGSCARPLQFYVCCIKYIYIHAYTCTHTYICTYLILLTPVKSTCVASLHMYVYVYGKLYSPQSNLLVWHPPPGHFWVAAPENLCMEEVRGEGGGEGRQVKRQTYLIFSKHFFDLEQNFSKFRCTSSTKTFLSHFFSLFLSTSLSMSPSRSRSLALSQLQTRALASCDFLCVSPPRTRTPYDYNPDYSE